MRGPDRQYGVTMVGVLIIGLLICLIAYIGMKIGPAYLTNIKVMTTLEMVAEQAAEERLSAQEIIRRIDARFHTDYINVVSARNDLSLDKGDGSTELRMAYETEVPLFFNISALLTFDNATEY